MKRIKKKKSKNSKEPEAEEYGVILKKEEKFRHRIYPQKGKVPEEDEEDDYEVV